MKKWCCRVSSRKEFGVFGFDDCGSGSVSGSGVFVYVFIVG